VSVLDSGAGMLKSVLGLKVSRATAALPATTQAAIFNINTGRVIVTSLVGSVTTAIQNQACTVKVTGNPTAGTDVDLSAVSASIAAKEVGSIFVLPAAAATALAVGNAGGERLQIGVGVVLNPGTLDLVTSATNTGSVKWDITYVPLDAGASITAA